MTELDLNFIKQLVDQHKIIGPVLELGAGYGGNTCKSIIENNGLSYYTSDMHASQLVDYVADFESDHIEQFFDTSIKFKSILVLNVLEHTLNPVLILDNARKLLEKDGSLIVIAPCSWTLHNYPIDCYRFMPNFFEQYAESRKIHLDRNCFEYLGLGQIASHLDDNGDYRMPLPGHGFYYWKSRIIHRIFNTFGRGMNTPGTLAIGVVYRMSA